MASTTVPRSVTRVLSTTARNLTAQSRHHSKRLVHAKSGPTHSHRAWNRPSAAVVAAAATVAFIYNTSQRSVQAEAADGPPEIVIEKKKKKGSTKEENRDLISSQHLQVKRSWENPGVYAWGSNTGKVVAPESNDAYIKTPQRIPYFDDVLLRDLKLDRQFGAAVLDNGDLVQWGKGYSEETSTPSVTLKGKDLKQIAISRDRIIGLSRSGKVYSIPASKVEQEEQPKVAESSWIPFWGGTSRLSYRTLTPEKLGYNERVSTISGGLEHVLMLTSTGRVFSAASSMDGFPTRGQLGVPGVTWHTRPAGPFDMPHEITTLKGFDITAIATGDTHSLALDREGRVFAFGDNTSGQLGLPSTSESTFIDVPSLLPTNKLYTGTNQIARVTSIAAGGVNSFLCIDATRVAGQDEDPTSIAALLGRVTADTFSCGTGLRGTLGNGRWTHIQDSPSKIPSLSGLFEYDEVNKKTIPIRVASISVGSTHASATLDNVTYLSANPRTSENDTNWGADCLWWGGNEFYQLGTGKRNNVATPVYIRPLDMESEIQAGRKEEHRFHVTPRSKVKFGGRNVDLEQRVECGRSVTAVYSGV